MYVCVCVSVCWYEIQSQEGVFLNISRDSEPTEPVMVAVEHSL